MNADAPVLRLDNVRKSFGQMEIIRGLSLDIVAGERHAIIGPNGAGKSTLFHLISGRLTPSSGRILLKQKDIVGLPAHAISRRGLARNFQTTNVFPKVSVYDNVRASVMWSSGYGYSFWRLVGRLHGIHDETMRVLAEINLSERKDLSADVLTYAEQRALEIGIAISGKADVLLLDEPTAGMSRSEAERAVELIRKVTLGKTMLMVEHDMSVVFGLADRISVVSRGQIIATDTPERIRSNPAVQEAYLGQVHVNRGE
jgi:branched-chain amino acid transport system ATP-binding protein